MHELLMQRLMPRRSSGTWGGEDVCQMKRGFICSYRLLPDPSCLIKYDVRMRTAPNTQGILDS